MFASFLKQPTSYSVLPMGVCFASVKGSTIGLHGESSVQIDRGKGCFFSFSHVGVKNLIELENICLRSLAKLRQPKLRTNNLLIILHTKI